MLTLFGCGISNSQVYPGTALTPDLKEQGVEILGQVEACQGGFCHGQWPMSLSVPPPASTYQAALRKEAAKQYNVPENEIVLGEVNVGYYSELNGTIRGWRASAPVGRSQKRSESTSPSSAAATSPMASHATWTTAKPAKPGWYWMKVVGQRSRIVEVADDPPHGLYLSQTGTPLADIPEHDRTWAGPLEEPQ